MRPRTAAPALRSRVKAPMDLGLIKLRLTKGYYKAPDDLAMDVSRVWANACQFNPAGSIVHRFALECAAFWHEHLHHALSAHAAGAAGAGARKRKTPAPPKRGDGDAHDSAPAVAPPRARTPKVGKRERPTADAPAAHDEQPGGGQRIDAAPKPASCGASSARTLAKGWALELVPEGAPVDGAGLLELAPPPPGQPRVRKAKVRWEPEDISAPHAEKRGAPGAPGAGVGGGGGAPCEPPPVRKQRRSSGGTRCGLQESGRDHSATAQWALHTDPSALADDDTCAAKLDALGRDALGTPRAGRAGVSDGQAPEASSLLASVPSTLYDVAAALPEINVGDNLEGVATDLDDLLDFSPAEIFPSRQDVCGMDMGAHQPASDGALGREGGECGGDGSTGDIDAAAAQPPCDIAARQQLEILLAIDV